VPLRKAQISGIFGRSLRLLQATGDIPAIRESGNDFTE
jgi:hypothetical protein